MVAVAAVPRPQPVPRGGFLLDVGFGTLARRLRLLGLDADFGAMLELDRRWAAQAIAATGNYGEIFERNLGSQSALDLERGLNAQWNAQPAGLIYGLPIL